MRKHISGKEQEHNSLAVLAHEEVHKPMSKEERGMKMLQRIFKRHLRRNFDYIQMGSIDYKRSLMLKQQKETF